MNDTLTMFFCVHGTLISVLFDLSCCLASIFPDNLRNLFLAKNDLGTSGRDERETQTGETSN